MSFRFICCALGVRFFLQITRRGKKKIIKSEILSRISSSMYYCRLTSNNNGKWKSGVCLFSPKRYSTPNIFYFKLSAEKPFRSLYFLLFFFFWFPSSFLFFNDRLLLKADELDFFFLFLIQLKYVFSPIGLQTACTASLPSSRKFLYRIVVSLLKISIQKCRK